MLRKWGNVLTQVCNQLHLLAFFLRSCAFIFFFYSVWFRKIWTVWNRNFHRWCTKDKEWHFVHSYGASLRCADCFEGLESRFYLRTDEVVYIQPMHSGKEHELHTFILNSWAEPEVLSSSGSSPPAAAAYMRKNRKDIWDGSTPKTDLLHSPSSSFSSGRKGWLNTYLSSRTPSNNMHFPIWQCSAKLYSIT